MIIDHLKIIEQREIAKNIFEMKMTGDSVSEMVSPGQFIHIKVGKGIDPLLRRPISICDVDIDKKILTILYRVEGKGTLLMSEQRPGETINSLGPLGTGFSIDQMKKGDKALLVGGGIGIPPLYYLAKQLVDKGVIVDSILGFRSMTDVFYEKEFAELGKVYITTEDGSKGIKGFVTDAMKRISDYNTFYTCGPTPMLQAVQNEAISEGYISLEERMGCGVGACLACVCDVAEDYIGDGKKYRKACSDGPVFQAGEVLL